MSKRRRTSSDIETDDSEDSEQYTTVPAVRKRKKLDPVRFPHFLVPNIFVSFVVVLDGALSATLWLNPKSEEGRWFNAMRHIHPCS